MNLQAKFLLTLPLKATIFWCFGSICHQFQCRQMHSRHQLVSLGKALGSETLPTLPHLACKVDNRVDRHLPRPCRIQGRSWWEWQFRGLTSSFLVVVAKETLSGTMTNYHFEAQLFIVNLNPTWSTDNWPKSLNLCPLFVRMIPLNTLQHFLI